MKILSILIGILLTGSLPVVAQSLDECQEAAKNHYPLIKQYQQILQATDLTIDNINTGWLPQVQAVAQMSWQSDVVDLPDALSRVMTHQGITIDGMRKDQYKIGIELNQLVYDGGVIKTKKDIARAQSEISKAQNDVQLYQIRKIVNNLYFGILLIDTKLHLNDELQTLLKANEHKLDMMLKGGTVAQCDVDIIKVERLQAVQQAIELDGQRKAYMHMLTIITGKDITSFIKPEPIQLGTNNHRPELRSADKRIQLLGLEYKALNTNLHPKLSVFVSGFYGYPGYDMYKSMMEHNWTLNGMIGARLSWNIGALYTRRNDIRKIKLQREDIENQREVFLLNSNMERVQQEENMNKYSKLMNEDNEIIRLRTSVRKATESKLNHGIIDASELVREITNENHARLQLSVHEIELLKQMYDLKYTIND